MRGMLLSFARNAAARAPAPEGGGSIPALIASLPHLEGDEEDAFVVCAKCGRPWVGA